MNESSLSKNVKALAKKEDIKISATKAEFKTEQDKIKKIQTYD